MKRFLLFFIFCTSLLCSSYTAQAGLKLIGPEINTNNKLKPTRYGPISKYETLWSIANRLTPNHSVTVYQTFMAIYKLNPDKFENGNVNKLIARTTLKIPRLSFIKKQTDKEARALLEPIFKPNYKRRSKKNKKISNKKVINKKVINKKVINKKVINKKTVSASKAQLKPKKAEINLSLSLGKQIDELKASLSLMSEKLINNNQKNKILKIKVQKLTDEIKNLNDQLTSEIMRYDKLTSSNNEYRKKLESIVPSTFSGGGILNAILHFLSSSIIYLVVTLLLPIILLIIIFILRKKNKRLLDEQEQKVIETNVFNEEVGVEPSVINEEVGVEPSVINEDVKVEPSVLKEEEEQVEPSESKKEESLEPSESKKEESLEPSVINEDVKVEPSVLKEEEEQVEPNESKKEESLEPTLSTDEDSKLLDNENTDPLWDSDVSEDTSEIIDLDENDGGVSENDLDLSDLDELDTLGDIALHELQKEISDIDPDTEEDPNSSELEIVDTDVFDTLASQTIKNDEFEIQEDDSADLDSVDSASEDPADLELDAFDEELPFNEDLALESSGTNEEDPFIDIDALLENGDSNVNNDDLGFTLEGKENDVLELSEIEDTNDEPGFNEDITIPNIAADEHDALIDIDALFEESGGDVNNDVAGSASEGIKDEDFESLEAGEANDDENSISSKLNLARAYLEIDDKSGAKEILDGIGDKCTAKQRKEINKLLKKYS